MAENLISKIKVGNTEYGLETTIANVNGLQTSLDNKISYIEQTLDETQKAQARANIGAGTSDVKSWDELEDKPFGGSLIGDTITWNGETAGYDVVELPMAADDITTMIPFCRISDHPPTASQIRNGNIAVELSNGNRITSQDTLMDISMVMEDGFAMLASLYIIVIPYNNYALADGSEAIVFPKRGIYMCRMDDVYVSRLHIDGFEFGLMKQLEAACVQGFEAVKSDTIEWNGEIGEREVVLLMPGIPQFFVHVSDAAPSLNAMMQGETLGLSFYNVEGGTQTVDIPADVIPEYVFQVSENVYAIGEYFAVVAVQDHASFSLGSITVTLPKRGVYFMIVLDEGSGAVAGYVCRLSSPAIQHVCGAVLEEKYIPDTIARKSDLENHTHNYISKVTSTNKAITRFNGTGGEVQNSKIIIEDTTNSRDQSKGQVIAIPTTGGKKMVYGLCTDQTDGTAFIGGLFSSSTASYPYAEGLAIGGSSGNLLWKGAKVTTVNDTYAAGKITAGTFAGQVIANSSSQAASTSLLRNSKLVSTDTNPTVNGEICWTYK